MGVDAVVLMVLSTLNAGPPGSLAGQTPLDPLHLP